MPSEQMENFDMENSGETLDLSEAPKELLSDPKTLKDSVDPLKFFQDFIGFIDGIKMSYSEDRSGFPENQNFSAEIIPTTEPRKRGGEWKNKPVTSGDIDPELEMNRDNELDVRDSKILKNYEQKDIPIGTIKIRIDKNFSYADLPKLIRQIQELHNEFVKTPGVGDLEINRLKEADDFILQTVEKLQQSYLKRSMDIVQMLNMPLWQNNDATTKDARKIWSKRAFYYFCISKAYEGREDVIVNGKFAGKMSQEFAEFIKKNPLSETPSEDLDMVSQRLTKAREHQSKWEGVFTEEAKEFFAADLGDIFDQEDLDHFLEETRRDIKTLGLEEAKERELLAITERRVEQKDNEEYKAFIERSFFMIANELDGAIKDDTQKQLIRENRAELKTSENHFAQGVKNELEDDLEKVIFARGEKELWRQSDIAEVFSGPSADKYFAKLFPTEWQLIEKYLKEAKESGDKEKISEMQTKIAQVLTEILYSEKFFSFKDTSFALNGIHKDKLVNCMARGQILHLLCKKILGVDTLGVTTTGHFFSVLPLANGRMLSLDESAKEIALKNEDGNQKIEGKLYQIGEHERIYRSALWSWLGFFSKEGDEQVMAKKKAIALNPNNPDYYYNLANILGDNGQRDEAIAAYRKAIALNPNNPNYYQNLVNTLGNSRKPKEAITAYEKAIALYPNRPDYYYNLANLLRLDGKPKEAIAAYEKAITLNPNNPDYYQDLSVVLMQDGQLDKAITVCEKAIALNPNNPNLYENLAFFLRKNGDIIGATVAYTKKLLTDLWIFE